jgi:hypothetical protein
MESYGVVVEGSFDIGVYTELIKKICPEACDIKFRVAGDRVQLMRKFPSLLRILEHASEQGGPVEKALVIRDADYKDVAAIEAKMRDSASRRTYSFPMGVGLHVVKQEMETWLLSDPEAIRRVALARGGKPSPRVPDPLEDFQDAKERLMSVLSRSGLNYTAEVCREIAQATDLNTLRLRCPSFSVFEEKVRDP